MSSLLGYKAFPWCPLGTPAPKLGPSFMLPNWFQLMGLWLSGRSCARE